MRTIVFINYFLDLAPKFYDTSIKIALNNFYLKHSLYWKINEFQRWE